MDPRTIGVKVRRLYDEPYARGYRESDEAEAASDNHRHYCFLLKRICASFGRGIEVLDLGCGTGRHFHCLGNVESLTGADVSLDMLREARNPVRKEQVEIDRIGLICANLLELELGAETFDFIYSIGVLGEHSPFDATLCGKLHRALRANGILFFTVMEREPQPAHKSPRRRIAEAVYPALPRRFRRHLDDRWGSFQLTEPELRAVLRQSPFGDYRIARHASRSSRWQGAHYDCEAVKRSR